MEQITEVINTNAINNNISKLNANEWGVEQVNNQIQMIQNLMRDAMVENEHYGRIPGCGSKKVLLKAGAEKLALMFRLAPKYTIERYNLKDGHREYEITCSLIHIPTGQFLGEGLGCCSTMESKFRFRKAERVCPECGKNAIIKGKAEYGGGWLCYKKKGGCGAKWDDDAVEISDQIVGKIENENIEDQFNTVKKIAKKRALVDAVLTVTAASDIFTQDIADPEIDNQKEEDKTPSLQRKKDKQPNLSNQRNFTAEAAKCLSIEELKRWWSALSVNEQKLAEGVKKNRKEELNKTKDTIVPNVISIIPSNVIKDESEKDINNGVIYGKNEKLISIMLKDAKTEKDIKEIEKVIDTVTENKSLYYNALKTKIYQLNLKYELKILPF